MITWLVEVKPNGTCPIKLVNKTKKNNTNKKGKYLDSLSKSIDNLSVEDMKELTENIFSRMG